MQKKALILVSPLSVTSRNFEDQGSGYPLRVSKVTLQWTGPVKILPKGQLESNLGTPPRCPTLFRNPAMDTFCPTEPQCPRKDNLILQRLYNWAKSSFLAHFQSNPCTSVNSYYSTLVAQFKKYFIQDFGIFSCFATADIGKLGKILPEYSYLVHLFLLQIC